MKRWVTAFAAILIMGLATRGVQAEDKSAVKKAGDSVRDRLPGTCQ